MSKAPPRLLELPDEDSAVILDYISLDPTRINITNKSYVVNEEPTRPEDCPVRNITQHDSLEGKNPRLELILKPVAIFRDPFRKGRNKIVLCELHHVDGKPLETSCEMFRGSNVVLEREILELHMKACLYAGIPMYGVHRECFPSMWEYQLAPLPIIEACDHLHVSRYILWRITEMYGLNISLFNPPCVMNTHGIISLHANLSTRKMREEGGMKYIQKALDNIIAQDQEVILQHYDLVEGNDYKRRLTGNYDIPKYDQTIINVGDKIGSSLRIPFHVTKMGKGYFEERRPSAEADPYDVIRVLTAAALSNDEDFKREVFTLNTFTLTG